MAMLNIAIFSLEDDDDDQFLIEQVIKETVGNPYKLFKNPNEFMEALTDDIHLCILDDKIGLGMTGLEVLQYIKNKNKYSVVIAYTGVDDCKRIIKYINAHIDHWVDKNEKGSRALLAQYVKEALVEAKSRIDILNKLKSDLRASRK